MQKRVAAETSPSLIYEGAESSDSPESSGAGDPLLSWGLIGRENKIANDNQGVRFGCLSLAYGLS